MKPTPEDPTRLSPEDERWVERLATGFAPPPLTPAERVAFDAALEARLARRRRPALAPALASAALAVAFVWLALPRGAELPLAPGSAPVAVARHTPTAVPTPRAGAQWEAELLYATAAPAAYWFGESRPLPAEYRAIASAFLPASAR